ncbi:TetR/AcrR family transcriptional regulator [Arthrobacter sp. ISL-5]|uniref:TetR/AcrR family transcriptional regulator n=1 Tax=Arthrobacter sp. ISL-5 TaxID=2819111 RepID=UPI001BE70E14|nr:TetR family transcriptional regulator [Arthrobacter sp. ISL-5]MBT2554151.1 TetR/AcrR family transcriptional regulator [Arthrobacter sp. ISL-5]
MTSTNGRTVAATRDRRPRKTNDGGRRAELIDELEGIFLAEGFNALTIEDLCKRLHCSKTTLYSVASSREQIIQKVTRHFFERSTAAIEVEVADTPDPAERIVRYLAGVGTAMSRNSHAFYLDMVSYEPTADIYRLNSRAAARKVQEMIEEGVRSNVFRPADAALAGQAISLLIDGVQSGELLEATGLAAGEAFTELGELLIHGLAVRPH